MRGSFSAWVGLSLAAHVVTLGAVTAAERLGDEQERPPAPPVLAGDTLEVPGLEVTEMTEAPPQPEVNLDLEPTQAEHEVAEPQGARTKPPRARPPKTVLRGGAGASAPESSGDAEPARFGAVGERGAVDLATAFTRGFPQAASADPIWSRAALGGAGSIDVVLTLDASGHLASATLEPGGSQALRQALSKTVALIRGRTFTARREVTRLHVVGVVSPDAVKSGAFGDVFAIGGSFVGRSGSAFFSLAIGRRIDVSVTER